MKVEHQLFQTKVLLSEGTIQQRFVARCTKEQKEFLEMTHSIADEQTTKNFNNLRFFLGKKTKKDLDKTQLYLEFIVSNGNVDLVQIKMQRFFNHFRRICLTTKMCRMQTELFALRKE